MKEYYVEFDKTFTYRLIVKANDEASAEVKAKKKFNKIAHEDSNIIDHSSESDWDCSDVGIKGCE